MLNPIRRALRVLGLAEFALSYLLIGIILLIIIAQVFSRYVLSLPLIWVEELASYLLIWLGFLSAAATLKQNRHVAIRVFPAMDRGKGAALMAGVSALAVLFLTILIIVYMPTAMEIEARARTIGLPVSLPKHWFFSVPLFVGCVSMILTALYGLAAAIVAFRDGGEVAPILPKVLVEEDNSDDTAEIEATLGGNV